MSSQGVFVMPDCMCAAGHLTGDPAVTSTLGQIAKPYCRPVLRPWARSQSLTAALCLCVCCSSPQL